MGRAGERAGFKLRCGSLRMILNDQRRRNAIQSSIDATGKQTLGDIVDVLFSNAYVTPHEVCLTLPYNPLNIVVG